MIEIKNLTFGYKKKHILFNNLRLNVKQGSIYGLLGKNGAGKTTLLKHICGLLFPDKGECLLFEKPAKNRLPSSLSNIFFLPEEFDLPRIRMNDFVSINSPFYPQFDKTLFLNYLNELEVDENFKLSSLSYGQKKKFLIAFGLAANTSVLLLDEPTNGLDIPSKSQFRKIIASSVNETRSIIISTHQVRDLSSLIDHIIILDNGKIVFNHSSFEISSKISFGHSKDFDQPDILYSEEILGGQAVICRRKGSETVIDLELLFNGVITNTDLINNEFKN